MADTLGLGPSEVTHGGSSPSSGTRLLNAFEYFQRLSISCANQMLVLFGLVPKRQLFIGAAFDAQAIANHVSGTAARIQSCKN